MTVLFVCVHNAGRSQIAEAFFNRLANLRGVHLEALSAGTMGAGVLNPVVVQAMEEEGISMEGHVPKVLTPDMVQAASKIVSMGCGVDAEACPAKFVVTEDWGMDDPAGEPIERVREIRDQILERVKKLFEEMY